MKHNRLARLVQLLSRLPRSGVPDIDTLAMQLGASSATVRRDLRDLREAGAFHWPAGENGSVGSEATVAEGSAPAEGVPAEPVAVPHDDAHRAIAIARFLASAPPPANDGPDPIERLEPDERAMLYLGARFRASEGDPSTVQRANAVAARVEQTASPDVVAALADIDARYRFGPRASERHVRQLVTQAIQERRVLRVWYEGERDRRPREREVEPLAQFFLHDRWSFVGYCRDAGDVRQFRHERCRAVTVSDEGFTPRRGLTLERFVQQRRRVMGGA